MRRALLLLLILAVMCGCREKKEEPEEETPTLLEPKPMKVVLVTGDVLYLDLMMDDGDAVMLKGPKGTGRFPKVLIRDMTDAPKEKPAPFALPGLDLFKEKKPPADYVAKSDGGVFHKKSCRQARHIPKGERVEFVTRDEAISQGYRACGLCNP